MKNMIVTFFASLLCVILGSCQQGTSNNSDSFMAYDGDFHKDVIAPQAEALKSLSRVIYPRICDDTETLWAAEQADSLCNALLRQKSLSNGEQLAQLIEIQNMIAYGMSYFWSIAGAYSNPEAAENARMMMQNSYASMDSLRNVDFGIARMLVDFEQSVYTNLGLFMELATQYSDGSPSFVENNHAMNLWNSVKIYMLFEELSSEVQAYRYATIENNTAFFMTYCPLALWIGGEEFQQSYQSELTEIAQYFDRQSAAVNEAIQQESIPSLPEISIAEFSAQMKQTAQYKAWLIRIFEAAILTIPESWED